MLNGRVASTAQQVITEAVITVEENKEQLQQRTMHNCLV
jgi:hypothetical protein